MKNSHPSLIYISVSISYDSLAGRTDFDIFNESFEKRDKMLGFPDVPRYRLIQ